MTATPQDVQAKIQAGVDAIEKATKTYAQMVKAYGSDTSKWPAATQWAIALGNWSAAIVEAGHLVAPSSPPPPPAASGTLPVGGFSPGGMFNANLASSVLDWEFNEYKAVAGGHRMMLRVDSEAIVQRCLDSGFDVLLVVGNTIRGFANLPGGSVSAYASLCGQIAARWKGKTGLNGARLAILEVGGNEPNMNGISAAQEVQILKAATPLVKAADPTLLVCNGGLAPAPDGTTTTSPRTYVTQMFAAGLAAGDIDLYQGHLYEDPAARGTWNTWDQTFPYGTFPAGTTIREQLDAHGMQAVPVMSGESGRKDSDATVVQNAFAEFAKRRAAGQPIGPLLIFTMRPDWITIGTDSGFGMTNLDRTRRPAWSAAQAGLAD